ILINAGAADNQFVNITVRFCKDDGIADNGTRTRYVNVHTVSNTGDGISLGGVDQSVITIRTSGNGQKGINLSGTNPVLFNISDTGNSVSSDTSLIKMSFYGAAPVVKAANPGTASGTDATVINNIITALRNLGLIT